MLSTTIKENNTKKRASFIVLYHSPCSDGWCALAIAHMWFRSYNLYLDKPYSSIHANPVYIGVTAGKVESAINKLIEEYNSGAKVLAFDLSFTYNSAKMLFNYFPDANIYDHHKTTLDCWKQPSNESNQAFSHSVRLFDKKLHYDVSISGAMLAWKCFYDNEPAPLLVQFVQDRDLWTWKLQNSREINSGITEAINTIYPYKPQEGLSYEEQKNRETIHLLDSWGKFMQNQPDNWVSSAYMAGSIISNITKRKVKQISRNGAGYLINGDRVYVCNTNDYISEIGELYYSLTVNGDKETQYQYDYVVIWRYDQQRDVCMVSMRTRQNSNTDVSQIAQQFSYIDSDGNSVCGGGHKAAAGFEVNLEKLFQWIGTNKLSRP